MELTVATRAREVRRRGVLVLVLCTAAGAATALLGQTGRTAPPATPRVLFLCPHGAAKSVLASAYFQRLAKERGLNVRVDAAGTEPDPEVAPAVRSHLTKNGYAVPVAKPRRATAADMEAADLVIAIGCDLKGVPTPRGTVVRWDDVPAPSENFTLADQKIRDHVIELIATMVAQEKPTPRQQPGAAITMFAPEQHDLYDGHYILSANRIFMVGGLNDPPGWDHLDNEAKTVKPVAGTAEIDVNDLTNTGTFEARLAIPEGRLVVAIDRFNEFNPCQNGGIVGFLHEHGADSGCGDSNWPKTFVYLAGWGFGHATLNGKPLYQDYEMHFMITQGIRDRKTLRVNYPMAGKKQPAGEVNPAAQQIDFYIRSPAQNGSNKPNREVFLHFFGMEVTWK